MLVDPNNDPALLSNLVNCFPLRSASSHHVVHNKHSLALQRGSYDIPFLAVIFRLFPVKRTTYIPNFSGSKSANLSAVTVASGMPL